jgi:two-component system, sensor histidine kinase and response regulator
MVDQDECLHAGMDDYISKPVKLEGLMAKIEPWSLRAMGNYETPAG